MSILTIRPGFFPKTLLMAREHEARLARFMLSAHIMFTPTSTVREGTYRGNCDDIYFIQHEYTKMSAEGYDFSGHGASLVLFEDVVDENHATTHSTCGI